MELLHFVTTILLSGAALILAWLMFVLVALKVIESRSAQEAEPVKDKSDTVIPLQVETAGNQFLCYHAKTMDFVCQGSSLDEIRSSFKMRYPDRSAAVVAGDKQAVTTLLQQLKELREAGHCI